MVVHNQPQMTWVGISRLNQLYIWIDIPILLIMLQKFNSSSTEKVEEKQTRNVVLASVLAYRFPNSVSPSSYITTVLTWGQRRRVFLFNVMTQWTSGTYICLSQIYLCQGPELQNSLCLWLEFDKLMGRNHCFWRSLHFICAKKMGSNLVR